MLPRYSRLVTFGLYPALLLIVNVLIVAKLFTVEYSAYLESNEGTFIAIVRQIALHPGDLRWWPLWACGLPFQNTYLPLLPLMAGGVSLVTVHSPALSYHQVCAAFFCLGPVFLYGMAWRMTRQAGTSLLAALAFSIVSPCAWLAPAIRTDLGSAWHLRRLQILAYYGEGPHTVSIAFLPLAILFLYLSVTEKKLWMQVAAGVFLGATILANAFGAVILGIAAVCLLATVDTPHFWRNLGLLVTIGALAYCWISPVLPPSVIAAIRVNSPTVDGDYRFTARSLVGLVILAAGFLVALWATRKVRSAELRFFLLFALLSTGIVLLGVFGRIYVVPQPHRYQIAMDIGLCLLAVFAAAEFLRSCQPALLVSAAVLLLLAALPQVRHDIRYAHRMIQATDITSTAPYRVARWMDEHMHGRRVMVSGS